KVKGILETYRGGQAWGGAVADVLFGEVSPSGKLAETFPKKLSDNPSYLFFPGEGDRVEYREGIFVGYRYYDKKEMEVLYPFGYGLSYTTFEYRDLKLDKKEMTDEEKLRVKVKVKNTGKMRGKEIVQLYVRDVKSSVIRPEKELKGFEKVELDVGEEKEVEFELDKRAFAYYDVEIGDWYVEEGEYEMDMGNKNVRNWLINISLVDAVKYFVGNPPLGQTFLRPPLYRFLGAKLGKATSLDDVTDPYLLEMEDGAVAGGRSFIVTHISRNGGLYLKKVKIGRNALVGICSTIMPGVEIGEGAVVAANSLIPMDTKIPPYTLWSGIPAKQIKSLKGEVEDR
ncbi:MAG: fibronectin type III-like domain-contianing protein, partial [Candidatus Jordarchaeales archaeon]